jgi:hypothetical protein
MLEDPPGACRAVASLYSWGLNYDPGRGPWPIFCDLIGWSEDEYGAPLSDPDRYPFEGDLGYVELDKLAAALIEYATNPTDVKRWITELFNAGLEE